MKRNKREDEHQGKVSRSAINGFTKGKTAIIEVAEMADFGRGLDSRVYGMADRGRKVINHHHGIFLPAGTMVEEMIWYGRADCGPDCDGRSAT